MPIVKMIDPYPAKLINSLASFRKKCRFLQSKVAHTAIKDRMDVSSLFQVCMVFFMPSVSARGKRSRLMAIPISRIGGLLSRFIFRPRPEADADVAEP